MTTCSVPECEDPSRSKGLCSMHYKRFLRHGSTVNKRPDLGLTTEERFWSKVAKVGPRECWNWTGAKGPQGHGAFRGDDGRTIMAYRWSWMQKNGPVPEELVLDHQCNNPSCVNPDHVKPATIGVNVLRGQSTAANHARKLVCDYGHPLSGDNLRIQVRRTRQGRVERVCRTCERRRESERRARRKAVGSGGSGASNQAGEKA